MRVPTPHNLINAKIVRLPKVTAITHRAVRGLRVGRDAVTESGDFQPHNDFPISSDAANTVVENVDDKGREPETQRPEFVRLLSEGTKALATVSEQALRAVGAADVAEIRLTVFRDRHAADLTLERDARTEPGAAGPAHDLVPHLRWLLTEATGTIANVAHQLETRANEVGDNARLQLRDDVSVLAEELATLKALLAGPVDWDSEARRLFGGEIPPFEPVEEHDDGDQDDR